MKDINLLLEEDKNARPEEKAPGKIGKAAKSITIAIVIAAFVVITLVVPKAYTEALNMRLSSVQDELKEQKYTEVKNINSQLAAVSKVLDEKKEVMRSIDLEGYPVGDILNTVKNNIPEGCVVNSIEYDNKSLKIAVKVQDIANIAGFLLNMDRLSYLQLSDASRNLEVTKTGEYVFSFDVGGKEDE